MEGGIKVYARNGEKNELIKEIMAEGRRFVFSDSAIPRLPEINK